MCERALQQTNMMTNSNNINNNLNQNGSHQTTNSVKIDPAFQSISKSKPGFWIWRVEVPQDAMKFQKPKPKIQEIKPKYNFLINCLLGHAIGQRSQGRTRYVFQRRRLSHLLRTRVVLANQNSLPTHTSVDRGRQLSGWRLFFFPKKSIIRSN